ncbi:MAG TPA: YdeI/OmpD-associated family protein [Candidatus Polarisedimenticolia bacterium]|nr:YdeI/OmpD-associated family protein [Candidatus Polarisedimenticolia bacterium]
MPPGKRSLSPAGPSSRKAAARRAAAPTFFATPADLAAWFTAHHDRASTLLVGFHKRESGRPSVTWPESVDEALCVGWIDGVRRRLDDEAYTIRFTPRRPGSVWSAINIRKAKQLIAEGRMRPEGLAAFEARRENRSGIYAYEQRPREMPEPYAGRFRKNRAAWAFFQAQPPSYRRTLVWYVISAKQEATRASRLERLIAASARGTRL